MTDERPDIAAAMSKMEIKVGGKREIKRLPEHLWEGEQVERMTTGAYGAGTGLLVATDRRLLFVKDGIMAKTSEDFPYEKISSVQWHSGMLMGTVTVFVSGNKAEIKNVSKGDGKAIVDLVRNRTSTGGAVAAPAAGAPASTTDPMVQLKQLGELRDAGILSDEEFAAKKAEILARL